MTRKVFFAIAVTALMGFAVTPSNAGAQGCKNGSSPHWYAFAAATGSKNKALNAAGVLGETQIQDIRRTNSPNNRKNLWLVYRGWFDSKGEATGELRYFKANGYRDAFVRELCMW